MKVRYRNTAFLIELSVNILVFAISCAILVAIFGKAWQLNSQTESQTAAATETMRLAEVIKLRGVNGVDGGNININSDSSENVICYYSSDWQLLTDTTAMDNAEYSITAHVNPQATPTGTLTQIDIVAETTQGEELYAMQTASYSPQNAGDANG